MTEGDNTGLAGQPEAGSEEAGLGQQNRGMPRWAQQRINELTAARRDAERQTEAERAERQGLTQEIAQLRQQIDQATGQSKPKGWDDFGADDLHKMLADEFSLMASPEKNPETGEVTKGANANVLAKAIREMIRREAGSLVSEKEKQYAGQSAAQQALQEVRGRIQSDFGTDALNEQSDLRQRAQTHWKALEKKYGKEGLAQRLAQTPDLEYLCFSKAAAELYAEGKAQSPQLARELEIARRQAGVGSGGEGMAEANTRFSTLLKKNDLDSAASELARQMMGGPT